MGLRCVWLVAIAVMVACGSSSSPADPSGDEDQVVTDDDAGGDGGGDSGDADGGDSEGDGDALPGDGDAEPTVCEPNSVADCYDGPAGALAYPPCVKGTKTCSAAGDGYGPCTGQVLPVEEICANGIDDDCNGAADDVTDDDGDGWSRCDGDCCETTAQCARPAQVNPGAFEIDGNDLDDDCDGTSAPPGTCDSGLVSQPASADDYARALGLCSFTTQSPPSPSLRKWGVIAAALKQTSGSVAPAASSHAIRSSYGGAVPQDGASFVVLSTGAAAALAQTNPAYVAPQPGHVAGTTATPPADWVSANGGSVVLAPGCPGPSLTTVNDSVMLELRVRVPTNAGGFTARFNFYSAEYPEWVCSSYNDVFVALLDSAASGNPADKNLAAFTLPDDARYLVSPSLASGATGLFTQCENGATGCAAGGAGTMSECVGTDLLTDTGYGVTDVGCGTNDLIGGATGWLTIQGAVIPGETVTLRFAIWDTSDGTLDSTVILDGFAWLPL